ncbi:YitT family protein [Desulfopila sp. IMCC35006]|uniref:YitT family protein n=1 Tax=Desulfopila sp. IMCC35006 TaxID=2569542 RepID=UPI0010AD1A5C|nr:YitT family protein [Desulfopila sp. IMCC35006]TKB25385.1 YitT family protein [Desulfopila sp. IMCC35006]
MNSKNPALAIFWDLILLTLGSIVYAIGAEAILVHHKFIIGGIYGTALLIYYKTNLLSPAIWYFLLNIPLLIAGWIFLSRRFFFYSLYGVCSLTFFAEFFTLNFAIQNQLYAAIAGGAICGVGAGINLRSRGSGGGLDIVAIILNQKFNFGVGKFFMLYNVALFSFVFSQYQPDIVIASIILTFISSITLDHVLSLFNQRKIVYILSENYSKIVDKITHEMHQGVTLIEARGAYSGRQKQMLMTITNNLQLKRIEEIVFDIDPDALFIVENSFNVIGSNFGKRKMY